MRRTGINMLVLLFLCVISSMGYASESAYEKLVAKGIAAIEADRNTEAAEAFSAALKEKPNDHTATLYLGIAQSRSKDKTAESTLKKALGMNPKDPRTNLELGILYYGKNVTGEARDYFDNTVKLAPGTAFAKKAEEYLLAMKRGGIEKPFGLSIAVGGQYDSNVVLTSGSGPLPQGISDESDWRAVFNLKGRYNFLATPKAEGSVSYNFYQSLHAELTEYNLSQHLFEVNLGYRISPLFNLRAGYQFEYLLAGGDEYDLAHSINPSLTITEGENMSTVVEYRYKWTRFKDSDFFIGNEERSGSNNLFGITQNIKLHPSVRAAVGYSYDRDNTREDYWDYTGNKGKIDLQVIFPKNIAANLAGEYYHQDYDGHDPVSGDKRKDENYTVGVAFSKTYSDRFSISVGQLFIRNKSNIEAFDYERYITSLFVNVRF